MSKMSNFSKGWITRPRSKPDGRTTALGRYIVHERCKKQMTQKELAELAKIPATQLGKIEHGHVQFPDSVLVRRIMDALGKSES